MCVKTRAYLSFTLFLCLIWRARFLLLWRIPVNHARNPRTITFGQNHQKTAPLPFWPPLSHRRAAIVLLRTYTEWWKKSISLFPILAILLPLLIHLRSTSFSLPIRIRRKSLIGIYLPSVIEPLGQWTSVGYSGGGDDDTARLYIVHDRLP